MQFCSIESEENGFVVGSDEGTTWSQSGRVSGLTDSG